MRRLSSDEHRIFDALKLKRSETIAIIEKIDVSNDEDAAHQRTQAMHAVDEGITLALRALTRPPPA